MQAKTFVPEIFQIKTGFNQGNKNNKCSDKLNNIP